MSTNSKKNSPWNTKDHDKFLEPMLNEFKASKCNKVLREAFNVKLRAAWFKAYPLEELSPELIEQERVRPVTKQQEKQYGIAVAQAKARGDVPPPPPEPEVLDDEHAKAFAREVMEEKIMSRLHVWYNNHSRASKSKSGIPRHTQATTGFLNLNPSSVRAPSAIQAFYAMNRSEFETEIANDWDDLKRSSNGEPKIAWINFWNTWLKTRLEQQAKEGRAAVEAFRKTYNEHADPTEPRYDRNERFWGGIEKLPRTIGGAAQLITAQTGWSTFILTGGPHPADNGNLKVVSTSDGRSGEGKSFEEFLGRKKWTRLQTWFSDFLAEKYGGPEELEEWALPGDDEGETGGQDTDDDPSSSSNSEAESDDTTAKAPKPGVSKAKRKAHRPRIEEESEAEDESPREASKKKMVVEGEDFDGKADKAPVAEKPPASESSSKKDKSGKSKQQDGESGVGDGGRDVDMGEEGPGEKGSPATGHDAPVEPSPPQQPQEETTPAEGSTAPTPPVQHNPAPLDGLKPVPGMEGTWETLKGASADHRWHAVLRDFVLHESSGPGGGNMSTSKRPKAIGDWIQSKKKAAIPSISSAFIIQWSNWWTALQPWRTLDGGDVFKLSREVPDDADWSTLNKGGKAGFYTIVVSLSWMLHRFPDDETVWALVGDVAWVLQHLRQLPVTGGGAVRNEPPVPEPPFVGARKRTLSQKARMADEPVSKRSKGEKPGRKGKSKGTRK